MVLIPKITEDKIAELDKRLEDLPNVREELVEKYREQKEMQLKVDANYDFIAERKDENILLYNSKNSEQINTDIESFNMQKEEEQKYYRIRR